MANIPSHTICDICGKDMSERFGNEGKYKYKIRKKFHIRKYQLDNAFSHWFSREMDICCDCFEEMQDYITRKKKKGGLSNEK